MRFVSGWGGQGHDPEPKPPPRVSSALKVGLSSLTCSVDILPRLIHQLEVLTQRQVLSDCLSRSHHEPIPARWVRRA